MTKVTTLAELTGGKTEQRKGKPIEFVHEVKTTNSPHFDSDELAEPKMFEHAALISKADKECLEVYDVIAAWDNTDTYNYGASPVIYLGHWNDGFVEQ